MPVTLPKTIVGNIVIAKALHITNNTAYICGSLWKSKKIKGVVIACARRIPDSSSCNATLIAVEWSLPGCVVLKELNGRAPIEVTTLPTPPLPPLPPPLPSPPLTPPNPPNTIVALALLQ